MLAATLNNNNPFFNSVRNANGTDMNVPTTSLYGNKLDTQLLCRAVLQHFGTSNIDNGLLSNLLNWGLKRSVPQPAVQLPEPVPVDLPKVAPQPGTSSFAGPTNFSMTAAITNALSANSAIVGPQLLTACSPLLQLAIRQALNECLPNFGQLSIQGNLEISLNLSPNANERGQSFTVLKFNDMSTLAGQAQSPCGSIPDPELHENFDTPTSVPMAGRRNSSLSQYSNSSSRRKSTNPVKCELSNNDVATNLTWSSVQTHSPASPPIVGHSGPTSPSTDSGVLDLSQAGSLAGSAPITPMKELNLAGDCPKTEQEMLEVYQKQFAIFTQLQSVWDRSGLQQDPYALNTNSENSVTGTPMNYLFQNSNISSAPSSPVKPVRRQRIPAGSAGRMCGLRRPNSNRRFPCNQCREEFPSLHTLEEHTMFHHGTYRCHICQAQFTQRSNLQRHALKHVGFKPFECRVCAKAYYRKDHLMRHMEMGHPGYTPRENITVHLTSSESLDFLNRTAPPTLNGTVPEGDSNSSGDNVVMADGDQTPQQEITSSDSITDMMDQPVGVDEHEIVQSGSFETEESNPTVENCPTVSGDSEMEQQQETPTLSGSIETVQRFSPLCHANQEV